MWSGARSRTTSRSLTSDRGATSASPRVVMPGPKAFIAAVLGGIGHVPGAVVGGLIIGIIESFVGGSQFSNFRDAIAFIILIAILLFRPSGLFGKYQAEKV